MAQAPIALVTGGSKGIGKAVALALARDGYDIWLNYLSDDEGAAATARGIESLGRGCALARFDVADHAAVNQTLAPLLEQATPYAVISNAGFVRDGLLAMMDEISWRSVIDVHLTGFYNVAHAVLPKMLRARKGRIVAMSSTSGQAGLPGQTSYAAAKAGLMGAVRSLAAEVGRRGILVNSVAPGFIETEMTAALPMERLLQTVPLKRCGTADEVAAVVSFLCSEKAAYITGQTIAVNGGVYM